MSESDNVPYTKLPDLENKHPISIISLDTEQDENGDPFVFCVAGITRNNKRRTIRDIYRTFTDARSCAAYLFKRKWYRTILTGNNLLFDLNHLTTAGVFNWGIISNAGGFVTATPTECDKQRYGYSTLKPIELNSFYPQEKLLSIVTDDDGEYLRDYIKFCNGHNATPYIDKHIIGKDGDMRDLTRACMSHCWAAVYALSNMQSQIQHMGSNIEITPAVTAQKLHRRKFLDRNCQITKMKDPVTDADKLFMHLAYYGGRTEYFVKNEIENVTGIDINSSYPNVMRNRPYPDMLSYREAHIQDGKFESVMDKYEGLAQVFIKAPYMHIPILPVKDSGVLTFPVGTWVATYTFPELRFAIKHGYEIKAVYKMGIARQTKAPIFKDYVDAMYKMKSNSRYREGAKLMLNSLYGKFGQKANEDSGWQIVVDDDCESIKADEFNTENYAVGLNGLLLKYTKPSPIEERGFNPKAYPLIAAYVTSYARINLWNAMNDIGLENIYYCDTDSIYADADKVRLSILKGGIKSDETKLGYWSVEHMDASMEIKGNKNYRVYDDEEWQYTISGIPKEMQPEFWENGECEVKRVYKRSQSIRYGHKLNTFYDHKLKARDLKPKRTFEGNTSKPLEFLDPLTPYL